jgi:hypothetical protein
MSSSVDTKEYTISIDVSSEVRESLQEIFPGGSVLASDSTFLDAEVARFCNYTMRLAEARREVAISGAMRWPWSQECRFSWPFKYF